MVAKIPPSGDSTANRPPCAASHDVAVSLVTSSATRTGLTGTVIASAFIAAAVASAISVSRPDGSAFAAARAVFSAAFPATLAISSASMIAGAARSIRVFSAARIGATIAANTADFREPGGRTTTV
nr:hypothetical protein GCM10020092_088740 [Actinoplanes digitatis]